MVVGREVFGMKLKSESGEDREQWCRLKRRAEMQHRAGRKRLGRRQDSGQRLMSRTEIFAHIDIHNDGWIEVWERGRR